MLLWSGRDRDARRSSGGGLLPLRKLPALFRRAGERVHVVEQRERERHQRRWALCKNLSTASKAKVLILLGAGNKDTTAFVMVVGVHENVMEGGPKRVSLFVINGLALNHLVQGSNASAL
jgi:hypothetical protein